MVSVEHFRGRPRGLIQRVRGQEDTTVLLHKCLTPRSARGEPPLDRGDHVLRWGARTWAPPLAIGWCGVERALVEGGGLHPRHQGR